MTYYSETDSHPKDVYSFESDINLSNPNSTVGQVFQSFVNSQSEFFPGLSQSMIAADSIDRQVECSFRTCNGSSQRARYC